MCPFTVRPVNCGLDGSVQSASFMLSMCCAACVGFHGLKNSAVHLSCVFPMLYASFSSVWCSVYSCLDSSLISFVSVASFAMSSDPAVPSCFSFCMCASCVLRVCTCADCLYFSFAVCARLSFFTSVFIASHMSLHPLGPLVSDWFFNVVIRSRSVEVKVGSSKTFSFMVSRSFPLSTFTLLDRTSTAMWSISIACSRLGKKSTHAAWAQCVSPSAGA